MERGEGKELLKELIKTFATHPNFFFLSFLRMQDLFVNDKGLRELACWLLGAQAALEESMPFLECNQITWGERERPMTASLRIQILKKGNEKNVNSKKTQPASTTEHCQEARCFAFCYHLFFSLPFALMDETSSSYL